jgi:CheY-like chemotaxis protein
MLPIVDGMTILKMIRKAGVKTPVLMLTARDTLMDKVSGLDQDKDRKTGRARNHSVCLSEGRWYVLRSRFDGLSDLERHLFENISLPEPALTRPIAGSM